ncbi:Glutamine transport ATP-binding protein GlnQ [Pigmentiphaga humi]|uniref:Glutamine transport ATP-binding protein GlnQ n=1 Tax=Pigmentiphaga humi TaxID=2478468 RepID=A0A3P4AZ90_9BURK|nr:amino acid ABC transporter ATP-binding protein [Pigmentiphaga humi]VCU68881.1 Glutamine transport ATP-binding protein GlnQ [Pigmentiphaga humi]
MALLTVRKLTMSYDGRTVLNGIDLDLEEGELKVVMGPSGCGKSTLLRCLNRLVTPTSGQILFRGEDVTRPDTDVRALRQRIGFVFQNFALYRHLTALENVTLGLRKLRGMPTAAANERGLHELARMDLAEHAHKYPAQLSGGQKQRVAIARALAMDPAVLFFDEPTSALDPLMAREIISVITQLRRDNVTMLCVTHDLFLARSVRGRVMFLDQGVIRAEGEADELFGEHADPRIRAFFSQDAHGGAAGAA